ncbi:MAG: alpha/beta fold hydrolase [Candidatus Latescibacterota bacterium]|nr:MAG: alpha/beta fold hydrolase [Candidatus Latescibacterota bacterium]
MMWYPVVRMCESGEQEIPFIVLAPQCPEGEMWTDTETLIALLDQVIADHRVDTEQIYLVGYSMGGNGAWYLAYKHPDRFAAIAPMSGMANVWWTHRLKDLPVWVFHGEKDDLVPARESQEMVDALIAKGGEVRFSLIEDRSHRPPTDEEHFELFEWFLTHRRSSGDSNTEDDLE